ncbi:MAG: hypothetical protein ABIK92_06515 [Pseudomonadota bacterium]
MNNCAINYDDRDVLDILDEREENLEAEIQEMSDTLSPEEFSEYLKGLERKRQPVKSEEEPRNLSDGLSEYIEKMAGRSLPKHNEENGNKDEIDAKAFFAEQDAYFEEYLKTDECKEKFRKELKKDMQSLEMFDFGLGKMSNEYEIDKFYGHDIYSQVKREITESNELPDKVRKRGEVSKELYQKMKNMRSGKIVRKLETQKPKKNNNPQKVCHIQNKIKPKKKQIGDEYFMKTKRGMIRNEAYRHIFKGPGIVYEWLWANIVRSEWIDTKGYPIKEKYFDKGYLAYCSSYRKVGEECCLHKNKVKEYIDVFKEAGIIKVEHLTPEGKTRGQSVFILGEWRNINDKIEEIFYRDAVFFPHEDGQNAPD